MNFYVCIKQVPDVSAPVHTGRMVLNAYDASAVEEALVLTEKHGGEVHLVCIGPEGAAETIRKALAMGADDAVHLVMDDDARLDSLAHARILADFFTDVDVDVIACGKQAQDTDAGLTGSMLAELLGRPYATNAVGLAVDGDELVVTRQGDTGQEVIGLPTPCLVTCSNDMNDPRIPKLKGIMAAKRKSIDTRRWDDEAAAKTQLLGREEPAPRAPGRLLEGDPSEMAGELRRVLESEAGVL